MKLRFDWLFLDVDGVMTDGTLIYSSLGEEIKKFNVLDGLGIMKVLNSGTKVAVISGRGCEALRKRLEELKITEVFLNYPNKVKAFEALYEKYGDEIKNSAHIGDDEPDLDLFALVKYKVTVPNAHDSVLSAADLILSKRGGEGAVREFCDKIC